MDGAEHFLSFTNVLIGIIGTRQTWTMKTQKHNCHSHRGARSRRPGLIKILDSDTPHILIINPDLVFCTFMQSYSSRLIHWFTNNIINIHELREERSLRIETHLDSAHPTELQPALSVVSLTKVNLNESNSVHSINHCHSWIYVCWLNELPNLMRKFTLSSCFPLSEGTMDAIQCRRVWAGCDPNHIKIFWKWLKHTHLFILRNLAMLKWIHQDYKLTKHSHRCLHHGHIGPVPQEPFCGRDGTPLPERTCTLTLTYICVFLPYAEVNRQDLPQKVIMKPHQPRSFWGIKGKYSNELLSFSFWGGTTVGGDQLAVNVGLRSGRNTWEGRSPLYLLPYGA